MTPKISIIIPTWNTARITTKCVNTIKKYLPTKDVQIIVIDNGSTDETYKTFSNDKSITYIQNAKNFGFAKANNIGTKAAKADYLLFLNSDMELIDDSILNMLDYLTSHSNIGAIGPKFLNPDMTAQGSVIPPQTPQNAFKEYWLKLPAYSKYSPKNNQPVKVWAISGGAILISKELFFKIDMWNEKYFMFYEDLELCRDIRRHQKDIYYFPETAVIHRHGQSGKNVADSANQWRRLIPGSIKYHGRFMHTLINLIIWSSQKFYSLFNK